MPITPTDIGYEICPCCSGLPLLGCELLCVPVVLVQNITFQQLYVILGQKERVWRYVSLCMLTIKKKQIFISAATSGSITNVFNAESPTMQDFRELVLANVMFEQYCLCSAWEGGVRWA